MTDLLDALRQPHTQLFLRLVLGGLLLLAGVSKLLDRASFRDAVNEYDVLPAAFARPFAAALPAIETALGALLLLGFGTTAAAALAVPLFASFALAIGINLTRGRDLDCHCFGAVQSERIGWPSLVRAAALAFAALAVALGASRFGALEYALFGASGELPPAVEALPVMFIAFVAFDLLVLLPEALAVQAAFLRNQAQRAAAHAHHHTNGRRAS